MRLIPSDFERMFGGPLDGKTAIEIINHDWNYKVVGDHGHIILDLLKRIDAKDFSIVGQNDERWQKGWQENLDEFRRTQDISALEPRYLRPSKYLRLNSQFIEPADPMFERNWYRVFRGWFARRYLGEFDAIFEFGCGSGHNVAFLAQEFPDKMIVGLDWTVASTEIVRALSDLMPNVYEAKAPFDFFKPWDIAFPRNSAVLTIGALEQTGNRWEPFAQFLNRANPAASFHIEPVLKHYDEHNLVDRTAIEIHKARGFWTGPITSSLGMAWNHRTGFGSLLLEGYSQFQWCPLEPYKREQARIDALEGAP